MKTKISFSQVISVWKNYQLEQKGSSQHISDDLLQSFSDDPDLEFRETILEHISICSYCAIRLRSMLGAAKAESSMFWETAWRKAAATDEIRWPQKIISEDGTYVIELLQNETDSQKGLIIVSIKKDLCQKFEGKMLSVVNSKGQTLLKGRIQNGEVFQRIDDLEKVDLELMVRPLD
jgi:hypothetical protein